MAYSGPSVGPWQISEMDINLLNEVFRQIEEQIKLLRGLGPSGTIITVGGHSHATTTSSGSVSHDSLVDVSTDDHHAKSHVHDGDGSGTIDHGSLSGLTDNDHTQYVQATELSDDAHSTAGKTTDMVIAGPNITITESNESEAVTISTTGFSGTVTPVVSITVANGIVTAVS